MSLVNTRTIGLLLLLPSLILSRGTGSSFSSPNMDTLCGQTIPLNGNTFPGTYFSLTSAQYKNDFDCILTIKGQTVSQRLIVVLDKLDIDCNGDKLLIYEGSLNEKTLLNTDVATQCGTKKFYLRTGNNNTVILRFISNGDKKVGFGFTVNFAINFPVTTCSQVDNLYRCRNQYCISNLFNCDERNWCGDNTQQYVCR